MRVLSGIGGNEVNHLPALSLADSEKAVPVWGRPFFGFQMAANGVLEFTDHETIVTNTEPLECAHRCIVR